MKVISREQFLQQRKSQIIRDWLEGSFSDAKLIDWLLIYGNDKDIEWLAKQFPDAEQGIL